MSARRLLGVFAHPDDESFGPGGTLARYAAEGVEVHVAIATDGAVGSVVEEFADARERLAEIRQGELEAAVDILGGHLHTLGYRDSGYLDDPAGDHPDAFVNADEAEATGRIVRLIREIRPQVVITHDESGGYFHPDHIMAHRVTTAAFHAAGDSSLYPEIGLLPYQPQFLYYTVIPTRWLKVFTIIMRLRGQDPTRVGRNEDIDLTQIGRTPSELHASIDIFRYWDTKQKASEQHRSQGGGGGFSRLLPEWLQKRIFRTEYFMRAYPPVEGKVREKDLFAGVTLAGK